MRRQVERIVLWKHRINRPLIKKSTDEGFDMISALTDVDVECSTIGSLAHCHINICFGDINPLVIDVSADAIEELLCEEGWLVIGDVAYCPECRKQMHD